VGREGTLWFKVPATLRIEVSGQFRPWISAKDLILYIIGKLGAAGRITAQWSSTARRSGG